MKKIFFLVLVFFMFLAISSVSAQDNETLMDESPKVSIETSMSNDTMYPGDQVEMTVTVKNIGNCDVNNLSIIELETLERIRYFTDDIEIYISYPFDAPEYFDSLYYSSFEPINPNWNFTKEPNSNISSNFHSYYKAYLYNSNKTFNTIHLTDTLKVNQSSSFKMIFNTTKRDFYEKIYIFYFIFSNDTLLTSTNKIISLSQIPRTFYINRKIVDDTLFVDVTVQSQDNATFSGNYNVKVADYENMYSYPYPEYYFPTYSVNIINNTGNFSLKLPLEKIQKYYTGLIIEPRSPTVSSLYKDSFVLNSIDERPLYDYHWSYNIIDLRTIDSHDLVKVYKNDSQFVVKSSGYNDALEFIVNGVSYNRSVDENGFAKLNINLEPGVYSIVTVDSFGQRYLNNITVLPTLIADDLVKYYRNDSQFYIKLIGYDSNPVKSKNITFNINGVFYTRETNDEGIAKLNINLEPGEYILTATDPITGLQMSYNITVLPKLYADDVLANSNFVNYNVKLVDDEGNALSGKSVSFNIGGVIFNNITDENGEAKLLVNLMSGSYIVTAEYLSSRISNKITI